MAKHRLPCPQCKHEIVVSLTQSGRELDCPQCGHHFEAPKLQELRNYPVEESGTSAPVREDQRISRSFFASGMIVFLLFGVAAAGLHYYSSQLIAKWDLRELEKHNDETADNLVPADILRGWYQLEQNPDLPEWQEHPYVRNRSQGLILRKFAYGVWAIAAVGLLMTILSPFLKNKKS